MGLYLIHMLNKLDPIQWLTDRPIDQLSFLDIFFKFKDYLLFYNLLNYYYLIFYWYILYIDLFLTI